MSALSPAAVDALWLAVEAIRRNLIALGFVSKAVKESKWES